jgi:hypothetical protein
VPGQVEHRNTRVDGNREPAVDGMNGAHDIPTTIVRT